MIKTDNYINNYLKKISPIFKNIHPNYITLTGLFFNMIILYIRKDYKFLFYLLNILRIICDNLDGIVARTYNKISYIGGLLDTTSDFTHIAIISYIFLYDVFNFQYFTSIFLLMILMSFIWYYMYSINALSVHSNLYGRKNYRKIDYIPILLSQNTYLSVIFLNIFLSFV